MDDAEFIHTVISEIESIDFEIDRAIDSLFRLRELRREKVAERDKLRAAIQARAQSPEDGAMEAFFEGIRWTPEQIAKFSARRQA